MWVIRLKTCLNLIDAVIYKHVNLYSFGAMKYCMSFCFVGSNRDERIRSQIICVKLTCFVEVSLCI